jgi:hypothetical protein
MRLALALLVLVLARPAHAELYCVIVAGLGGEPQYQKEFDESAAAIGRALSRVVKAPDRVIRLGGAAATRDGIEKALRSVQTRLAPADRLAVFAIGHGSYDGEQYKFNVPGPDPTAEDWAKWLAQMPAKRQLVVQATSASGALVEALQAPGRIVVTATRSGMERNATVFGRYWAEALSDPAADLDKNGWISAREAFDHAQRAVAGFYARGVRLATEHPRMEGEAASFELARVEAEPASAPHTGAGPTLARRAALLGEIEALRAKKAALDVDAYYRALEKLAVELAELQDQIEYTAPREAGER